MLVASKRLTYLAVGVGIWLLFAAAGSGVSKRATIGLFEDQARDLGFEFSRADFEKQKTIAVQVAFPLVPFVHFAVVEFSGSCVFTKTYLFVSARESRRILWEAGG